MSRAYAVEQQGEVLVNTIHAHPRGAIINWIVSERILPLPSQSTPDELFYKFFELNRDSAGARVVEVLVTPTRAVDPPYWGPEGGSGDPNPEKET